MHDRAAGLGVLLPQLLEAAEDDPLTGRSGASAACKLACGLLLACENTPLARPAKVTVSHGCAFMVSPPDNSAKLPAKCAIRCCIAPVPAARFLPAVASSPSVPGPSMELPAPDAEGPEAPPAARLPW
eukprot:9935435-Alexandrium_andersonii.AAC.1